MAENLRKSEYNSLTVLLYRLLVLLSLVYEHSKFTCSLSIPIGTKGSL